MKTHLLLCLILFLGVSGWADDVIPSVSREEMSAYKNAFGKVISESRNAERPERGDSKAAAANTNFGAKASDAVQSLKGEILQDNKNFGTWVNKQREHQPEDGGANAKGGSDSAKASTEEGRPHGHGHGHGHGNQGQNND